MNCCKDLILKGVFGVIVMTIFHLIYVGYSLNICVKNAPYSLNSDHTLYQYFIFFCLHFYKPDDFSFHKSKVQIVQILYVDKCCIFRKCLNHNWYNLRHLAAHFIHSMIWTFKIILTFTFIDLLNKTWYQIIHC